MRHTSRAWAVTEDFWMKIISLTIVLVLIVPMFAPSTLRADSGNEEEGLESVIVDREEGSAELPVCPFIAEEGRIVATFAPTKLYSDGPHHQFESAPVAVNLPAGEYTVTLFSFDAYTGRENVSQTNESWFVQLKQGLVPVASTNWINDLSDNTATATRTEVVGNPFVLTRAADHVTAYHAAYPTALETNGVYPICAAFDFESDSGSNGNSGNGDDDTEVDVCSNIEGVQTAVPSGYHLSENQCVADSTGGSGNGDDDTEVDVCSNIEGVQTAVPSGYHLSENQCVADSTGGSGNGDDTTPTPSPSPSPSPAPENNSSNNSGGGGGNGIPGNGWFVGGTAPTIPTPAPVVGQVLGATTCSTEYIGSYIKPGGKNNVDDVKKLQSFLNENLGLTLPQTGFYGPLTIAAVKTFQIKNAAEILRPWVQAGLHESESAATGYVYKTTKRKINLLKCPDLNSPMPQLP